MVLKSRVSETAADTFFAAFFPSPLLFFDLFAHLA
jgi:hypothetical protein